MHVYLVDSISNPTKSEYQGFLMPNGQIDKNFPEMPPLAGHVDVKCNDAGAIKAATDEQLVAAMDALDATLPQTEGGLESRYAGAFSSNDMPHNEYWLRSVKRAKFGKAGL